MASVSHSSFTTQSDGAQLTLGTEFWTFGEHDPIIAASLRSV
ncbi:hypothetical protein NUZ5A_51111 [Candidatus Nitrosotenuis uzonensis]|uniref:Uncharacterized protein n=1 Tax=Candidatus Nitrosotenuis uzonensis TaxID=1407055 RepID=A0A812F6T0_9ARCH|nr:hypothetical protein NUZ5A_51111 [Candidatus Nitrosotenuis uzonensis]